MEGQWIGRAKGDTIGNLIVDLDDCYDHYRGTARLFAVGEPGPVCEFTTRDKGTEHKFSAVPLAWLPRGQTSIVTGEQIAQLEPEMAFPRTAEVTLSRQNDVLRAEWLTDVGTKGEATLHRGKADLPSSLSPHSVNTWKDFKEFAVSQEPGKYIFRGQPEAYRLRTAFHRTHRKDLARYLVQDIPLAHRSIISRTRHLFDIAKPEQNGAFLNLLQHHGYPTPLLDWTYSPFVAAFFAYRRRQAHNAPSGNVRIFAFDKEEWVKTFNQIQVLTFADLHFSMLEALAIENPRAIPQQALSTLTNIDDIESYIVSREDEKKQKFLYAIDLPASLRREVMVELSFMGITAGSLFPGLDGACEELRGRMFHQQLSR